MAHIVPIGIDFWASAKSPDLLEPAMIPRITQKKLSPCMTTDHIPLSSTVVHIQTILRQALTFNLAAPAQFYHDFSHFFQPNAETLPHIMRKANSSTLFTIIIHKLP
jgi:hypothetical protein